MRSDKKQAIKLRLSGNSYKQISDILDVPKSTLSSWLKDVSLSKKAQNKIQSRLKSSSIAKLIARNKYQSILAKINHKEICKQGEKEAKKLFLDPLFLLGTSLYWAEGYKQGAYGSKWKSIDFANSDSDMIKIMIKFFIKFLNVKKSEMKVQIMIHDKNNTENAENFWHKITGIPKENFIKTFSKISISSLNKQKRKLENGTIHIRINNVKSFFRLIGWINEVKTKFI